MWKIIQIKEVTDWIGTGWILAQKSLSYLRYVMFQDKPPCTDAGDGGGGLLLEHSGALCARDAADADLCAAMSEASSSHAEPQAQWKRAWLWWFQSEKIL